MLRIFNELNEYFHLTGVDGVPKISSVDGEMQPTTATGQVLICRVDLRGGTDQDLGGGELWEFSRLDGVAPGVG